jgi:general stress protein 26
MADTDRVWELMKKISICMFASWDGRELHARPMGAYVRREDNAVFFLADARRHKDAEIEQYGKVCLAFADTAARSANYGVRPRKPGGIRPTIPISASSK